MVDWAPLAASAVCVTWQELRLWVVESGLGVGLVIWWVSLMTFGLYVGWCDMMWDYMGVAGDVNLLVSLATHG